MTQGEKRKCLELLRIQDLSIFHGDIRPLLKFGERDFVKIIPEQSIAVLAKDRLPEGFVGTYQDLREQHEEFMTAGESNVVRSTASRHGIRRFEAGKTLDTVDGQPMSATRVRKALIEGNRQELAQLLAPEVYASVVTDRNIKCAGRRYRWCLELAQKKQQLRDEQVAFERDLEQEYLWKNRET